MYDNTYGLARVHHSKRILRKVWVVIECHVTKWETIKELFLTGLICQHWQNVQRLSGYKLFETKMPHKLLETRIRPDVRHSTRDPVRAKSVTTPPSGDIRVHAHVRVRTCIIILISYTSNGKKSNNSCCGEGVFKLVIFYYISWENLLSIKLRVHV